MQYSRKRSLADQLVVLRFVVELESVLGRIFLGSLLCTSAPASVLYAINCNLSAK